ncbi:MAG: holo-ACP synthase [Chloroflexi bacterium]|nr:holo-ACP synthase [Chloroflexota bacterium]
MSLYTGVDLLEIPRIQEAIERHGERFLKRIFTPAEREICQGNLASLAARFAAKEAVAKALGTGLGKVAWTDIEILRDESGAPVLNLSGLAQARSNALCLQHWSISLSHTREYAIAMAVAST